jgi:hypothetical protein
MFKCSQAFADKYVISQPAISDSNEYTHVRFILFIPCIVADEVQMHPYECTVIIIQYVPTLQYL